MLFLLLFLLLSNPKLCLAASIFGMNLWFNTLFPTLLPFIIISNIILNVYSKQLKNPSLYVIFIGLSCGCPMAAITAANLYQSSRLTKNQAETLSGICNCLSPAFITSYCFINTLHYDKIPIKFLLATYAPILLFLLLYKITGNDGQNTKNTFSQQENRNLTDILDKSIMNGFLAITKLGGYIILCSILADYAGLLVKNMPITKCILTGFLEITNGIAAIGNAPIPIDTKLLLTGGMLGFGGVCCTLQTVSILHAAGLSTKKYIYHRIRLCIATILSYLFVIYVL